MIAAVDEAEVVVEHILKAHYPYCSVYVLCPVHQLWHSAIVGVGNFGVSV